MGFNVRDQGIRELKDARITMSSVVSSHTEPHNRSVVCVKGGASFFGRLSIYWVFRSHHKKL